MAADKAAQRWTSAGRLDRGEKCPTSISPLPETYEPAGKPAIWGKAVHSWAENDGILGDADRDPITKLAGEWPTWVQAGITKKSWVSGVRPVDLYPPGGAIEVMASLEGPRLETATVIPGDRWPDLPGSLRMKIDYWGSMAEEPWVKDLKTGRVPPSPLSLQLAAAALVAKDIANSGGVHASIDHWPRYPLENKPTSEWHYYDSAELEDVRGRLVALRDLSTSPNPPANPGEWCRYCPVLLHCPKKAEAEEHIEASKFVYNKR